MPPYRVYRDFLDRETLSKLLDWALANEKRFEPARIVGGYNPELRNAGCTKDFGPQMQVFEERMRQFSAEMFKDLLISPFSVHKIELEMVASNDAAFFKRHIDTRTGDQRDQTDRLVSAVYYFYREPKSFTGGALRVFPFSTDKFDSGFTEIQPEQNLLVAFPSWAVHEVAPVSCVSRQFADSRFSINSWFHRAQ